MEDLEFIDVKEIYIKTDRTQGNMVVLKESESDNRYFLMFIGEAEITAIAKEKGFVEPKRPLTHDLYLGILNRAGIPIDRVEIYQMLENTYYARVFAIINGQEEAFDSRPSDAVALALHQKCPIMINKALLHRELTPDEVKEYEDIVKTVKF
jgi:hypothetical protein